MTEEQAFEEIVDTSDNWSKKPVQVLAPPKVLAKDIKKCHLCNIVLNVTDNELVTCPECGCLVNLEYDYKPPTKLSIEDAVFHFNMFHNSVRSGIVHISTPLKKSNLLDVEGSLGAASKHIESKGVKYSSKIMGQYDFLYLSDMLTRVPQPKEYLKSFQQNLKPKGIVQVLHVPQYQNKGVNKTSFNIPDLCDIMLMCGYIVNERLCLETNHGHVICCQ